MNFLSDDENEKVNLWNNVEDKNMTECDNGFHVVKDICVDDGLPHGEKIECEKGHDELSCDPFTVNGDKYDSCLFSTNGASDELKLVVESKIVDSSENLEPGNSMEKNERKLDSNSKFPNISSNNDVDQQLSESVGTEAAISNETKMDEKTTSNFVNVKPETNNDPQSVNELPPVTAPVSGLMSYTGPISSAGSISHRSDGSNTSVGSFVFPILQNEWNNSSPVRLSKVDPRRSPKNGGWRQAFMCCGF